MSSVDTMRKIRAITMEISEAKNKLMKLENKQDRLFAEYSDQKAEEEGINHEYG